MNLSVSCDSPCFVAGSQNSATTSPTPKPTLTPPPELEMSGTYKVEGNDDLKTHPYEGILAVTNQGDGGPDDFIHSDRMLLIDKDFVISILFVILQILSDSF